MKKKSEFLISLTRSLTVYRFLDSRVRINQHRVRCAVRALARNVARRSGLRALEERLAVPAHRRTLLRAGPCVRPSVRARVRACMFVHGVYWV